MYMLLEAVFFRSYGVLQQNVLFCCIYEFYFEFFREIFKNKYHSTERFKMAEPDNKTIFMNKIIFYSFG